MERNNKVKISLKYTSKDYYDLRLSIESNEAKWNKALEILSDRFNERYFSTIHYLSSDFEGKSKDKIEQHGFAIMAINCLLIDTFYQFEYGLETSGEHNPITKDKGVGRHYTDFLRNSIPCFDGAPPSGNRDLAELFYEEIRCGILHSAQTKGCSLLTCDGDAPISYCERNGDVGIKVNVGLFSDVLERYFNNDYVRRIKDENAINRENFIKKMKFVCQEIFIE